MNERYDNAFRHAAKSEATEHDREDSCCGYRAIVPLDTLNSRRENRKYASNVLRRRRSGHRSHYSGNSYLHKLSQKQSAQMVRREFRLSSHRRRRL